MATQDAAIREEMLKMERAAQVLMGENSGMASRREAEAYFVNLKESNLNPAVCKLVLETTDEPVVMFQIAQCLRASVIRNWLTTPDEELVQICEYMLQMPLARQGLPGYVVSEVFRVAATLIKRGIAGNDPWDVQFVLDFVKQLLENKDENMQTLGLRVVEAISLEFSTLWRNSASIGFDFHHKAKKKFEETLLKQFMQMSLSALSVIINSADPINEAVCDRFLRVAVIVLQWNFTTSIRTAFLKVNLYSMNTAVALRPPPTWSDLFVNEELLPFFFGLHKKVRHSPQLADNSLSCICQLAAVMGSCLEPKSLGHRVAGAPQPHDLYVQMFCSALVQTFQDCFPYEVLSFTTAMHRIFSHHPMPIFKRFPEDLMAQFVKFIVHWAVQLAQPAMTEKKNEEAVLVESYTHVLTCWSILLRSCPTFPTASCQLIMAQNNTVIEAFVKAIMAPPFGGRTATEDVEDEDDDELGDNRYYSVILSSVGCFCRLSIECFTGFVVSVLSERIQQREMISSGLVSESDRLLWLEDVHWILLLIGSFFQDADRDVQIWLEAAYSKRQFVVPDIQTLIIQSLHSDSFTLPEHTDPVVTVICLVCHWFGVLYRTLEAQDSACLIISPELYRTTFMTFSVVISFLSSMGDESPGQFFDADPSEGEHKNFQMPILPSTGQFSAELISMIIRQIFIAFKVFPSEEKLCNAAVNLLLQESDKRAGVIANCPLLYELISTITLERLPARRNFMTCLVTIGSNVNSSREREQMHEQILVAMASRFTETTVRYLRGETHLETQLVDLLECFSGVARAAQIESGTIIYEFLAPILRLCVQIMQSCSDSQSLVVAILDLFRLVATTVFVFMDLKGSKKEPESSFFDCLMSLLDSYQASQFHKYQRSHVFAEVEQEEQISDLIMLLKIVSNSVSKPYIMYASPADVSDLMSSPLCKKTLDMMLPIMGQEGLQLPGLSGAYFRLILHISECCPMVFLELSEEMVSRFVDTLSWALSGVCPTEPTRLTLESLSLITKMLTSSTDTAQGFLALKLFNDLVGKTFENAVHSSGEVEIHVGAIKAVYGFISLNKNVFMEYVQSVINRPENAEHCELAVKAFVDLVPKSDNLNTRQEYKTFTERFEKFLEVADVLNI